MMQRNLLQLAATVMVSCATFLPAQAQTLAQQPSPPETRAGAAHMARAYEMAVTSADKDGLGLLCQPTAQAYQWIFDLRGKAPDAGVVYAKQAFDNLYYIGFNWVGSWVLVTSEGIIVIDALNSVAEVQDILIPKMKELGLDPTRIKYVLVTHGHIDHLGGAQFIQATYGAQVALSETDWKLVESRTPQAAERAPTPRRDIVIEDGQQLTLGDTTLTLLHTPGHTAGTVGAIVPVLDKGQRRVMTLAGGSIMQPDLALVNAYHDSFHKLWEAGRKAGAVGALNTHAFMHGAFSNWKQMESAGPGMSNPFVLGQEGWERFMAVHHECVMANVSRVGSWMK